MKVIKKIIISFLIFLITYYSILPTSSLAASDDDLETRQREALVKVALEIVNTGNSKKILRYSQGHRNMGFNWQIVTDNSARQTTATTINLTSSDLQEIERILKRVTGRDIEAKATAYTCIVYGDYIKGTLPFDCSSFCSAIYKFTLKKENGQALTLANGGNAYTTSTFKNNSSQYFEKISVDSAQPGDILWKSGHVALYLGDTDGNGIPEIAEAVGMINGENFSSSYDFFRTQLLSYLRRNPTYIKEHPNYNGMYPDLQRVFMTGTSNKNASVRHNVLDGGGQVRKTNLIQGRFTEAYRLKRSVASQYTNINTLIEWPWGETEDFWSEEINLGLEDQELVLSEGFFHKGAPTYGEYIGRVTVLNWLINAITDTIDWIVGVIFTGFKVQVIGWTSVFESIVAYCVNFQATQAITDDNSQNMFTYEPTDRVTIEDIVYNKIPILDINIFNLETAAGEQIEQGSIIYTLRGNLATWYYTIRTIAIMVMLVILIYVGIKMAFSTIATEKAEYKRLFKNWLMGFIIIFTIHYFMVIVININEGIVEIIEPDYVTQNQDDGNGIISFDQYNSNNNQQAGEKSLYEQVKIMAYEIKATTGWAGTIMYVVLVYYLVKFLLMYIKRFFVIGILIVISPIVGISCAIQKKQQALKTWGVEFTTNVLIQSIHALLYTLLVSIGIDMMAKSPIRGTVLALICIGFIFTGEKLIKKIFRANKARSVKGLGESTVAVVGGYYASKAVTQTVIGGGKIIGKGLEKGIDKAVDIKDKFKNTAYDKLMRKNIINNEYDIHNIKERINERVNEQENRTPNLEEEKVKSVLEGTQDTPNNHSNDTENADKKEQNNPQEQRKIKTYSDINSKIERIKVEEREARKAYANNVINYGKKAVLGKTISIAQIPILVTNPVAGIGVALIGFSKFSRLNKRTINSYKTKDGKFKSKKLIFAWATAGESEKLLEAKEEFKKQAHKLNTTYPKRKKKLEEARQIESNIIYKIANFNSREMYETDLKFNINNNETLTEEQQKKLVLDRRVYEITQKKEFEKAVNITFQDVSKEEVETAVSEYLVENEKTEIKVEDIDKLKDKINKTMEEKGKDIKITDFFGENVKKELAKQFEKVEVEPTEENIEKTLPKLSLKEITDLFTKATKEETSINREVPEKYKDIMEEAKKLKEINKEYEKIADEQIYTDVAELVKNIKSTLEK